MVRSGRTSTPGRLHVDQQAADALVLGGVGVGADVELAPVGVAAQAVPGLLAVDHEVVAVEPGRVRSEARSRAGVGLRHALAPDLVAPQHRGAGTAAAARRCPTAMMAGAMLETPMTLTGPGAPARDISSSQASCSAIAGVAAAVAAAGQLTAAQPASARGRFQLRRTSKCVARRRGRACPASTTSGVRCSASHVLSSWRKVSIVLLSVSGPRSAARVAGDHPRGEPERGAEGVGRVGQDGRPGRRPPPRSRAHPGAGSTGSRSATWKATEWHVSPKAARSRPARLSGRTGVASSTTVSAPTATKVLRVPATGHVPWWTTVPPTPSVQSGDRPVEVGHHHRDVGQAIDAEGVGGGRPALGPARGEAGVGEGARALGPPAGRRRLVELELGPGVLGVGVDVALRRPRSPSRSPPGPSTRTPADGSRSQTWPPRRRSTRRASASGGRTCAAKRPMGPPSPPRSSLGAAISTTASATTRSEPIRSLAGGEWCWSIMPCHGANAGRTSRRADRGLAHRLQDVEELADGHGAPDRMGGRSAGRPARRTRYQRPVSPQLPLGHHPLGEQFEGSGIGAVVGEEDEEGDALVASPAMRSATMDGVPTKPPASSPHPRPPKRRSAGRPGRRQRPLVGGEHQDGLVGAADVSTGRGRSGGTPRRSGRRLSSQSARP